LKFVNLLGLLLSVKAGPAPVGIAFSIVEFVLDFHGTKKSPRYFIPTNPPRLFIYSPLQVVKPPLPLGIVDMPFP